MKLRKLLLYVCAFIGITAHAQEDMLNVTRIKKEAAPQLNGIGSAVFKAKTAVIRTSDNEYECSQAKKVADGYEYEMQIDVSKGKVRVFIVSRRAYRSRVRQAR